MKRISFLFVAILAVCMFSSCGGGKNATKDVEIDVPCSGSDFRTNKEYFRSSAMGLSTDMTIAKKKAMSSARSELATAINSTVKAVTDDYSSSYQQGQSDESKRRFQELSRTVVEQELNGLRIICEKTFKAPDNNYKVYVSVELSGKDLAEKMANRIKSDDKLRIDFEYEKFKKVFEEEMSKAQ